MNKLDSMINKIIDTMQNICSILLLIMLGIVFVDVFARYLFNSPIIWSEELTLMLLIWFGFFSMSNELYHEKHIRLTMAYDKFSPRKKKIVSLINILLFTIFFILMSYNIVLIMLNIGSMKMPVSKLPKVMLYIPVFCSSVLMTFYSIALFFKKLHFDFTKELSDLEKNE